ncbi:MAG: MerR family transcriptional regulator, partial [Ignavibacteriaceae bacterium]|nr:MerR family transcriptional regulator [Ignavibacteriaceae bacterium]
MYEREGLILPYQKDTGHRLYSDSDIDRLQC